jgi:hypothetical protein
MCLMAYLCVSSGVLFHWFAGRDCVFPGAGFLLGNAPLFSRLYCCHHELAILLQNVLEQVDKRTCKGSMSWIEVYHSLCGKCVLQRILISNSFRLRISHTFLCEVSCWCSNSLLPHSSLVACRRGTVEFSCVSCLKNDSSANSAVHV